jgi:hypothetical protein
VRLGKGKRRAPLGRSKARRGDAMCEADTNDMSMFFMHACTPPDVFVFCVVLGSPSVSGSGIRAECGCGEENWTLVWISWEGRGWEGGRKQGGREGWKDGRREGERERVCE